MKTSSSKMELRARRRPPIAGPERIRTALSEVVASIFVVACLLTGSPNRASSAQPEALHASYSALVPSGAPFWIAQELKLFEREGLKVDLVYISEKGEKSRSRI
jgi:ABC-type nitrate/sulfonate/bicarbonate transport system substrate-binding protein